MRVDPIKPTLKAPGSERLMLKYDQLVSTVAFNFNLRCYTKGGHLEALRWAREHDCPWDSTTCAAAAAGGQLDVVKWARKHGCPWSDLTCRWAAVSGHLEVLKWAREHGCPYLGLGQLRSQGYRVPEHIAAYYDRADNPARSVHTRHQFECVQSGFG